MDYLYAFLGGLTAKIYDDLVDNDIIKNDTIKEVLKGSQWMSLTLISHNDFNFTLINYIVNVLNAYANRLAYSLPYESSLLILYPFLLLVSFPTISYMNIYSYLYFIWFVCAMAIEPLIIKEEYSYRKLFIRVSTVIAMTSAIYISSYFTISPSIQKFLYYGIGYMLFSSGFQAYMLYNDDSYKNTVNLDANSSPNMATQTVSATIK